MSYLSASDPRAHFGFAEHTAEDTVRVSIRWPDGLEEVFEEIALDRVVVLNRGGGT